MRLPCERKRAAPSGAFKRPAFGRTLPQGRLTRPEEVQEKGAPAKWSISRGDKRNKNAELSRRALDILAGLDL